MSYTSIPNTDVDAESPITESLMTQLRDNPIGMANANAGADEPPRVLCNASGATALATLDGNEGDVLQVVNEVNPGTGQSGLLIRAVDPAGTAVHGSDTTSSGASALNLTATVDLTLDTTSSWSITVSGGTVNQTTSVLNAENPVAGVAMVGGGVLFSSGSISSNSVVSANPNSTVVNTTVAVSVPSAGVLRVRISDDPSKSLKRNLLISAVAVKL